MATRAVQQVVTYYAWNTSTNAFVTGDAANHSTSWIKDGTRSATTNATAEVDATNCPGAYKVTMTSTEVDCWQGVLGGKSSTANVVLIPTMVAFEYLNTAAPATAGVPDVNVKNINNVSASAVTTIKAVQGLTTADTISALANNTITAASIAAAALNGKGDWNTTTPPTVAAIATGVWQDTTAGDFTVALSVGKSVMNGVALGTGLTIASVSGAVGSVTGNVGGNVVGSVASVTAGVTVSTNNDKTGYTASTVTDKTGYALSSTGSAALTEDYAADGATGTLNQMVYMIWSLLAERNASGTTLTTKKLDGTTTSMTFTLDAASPSTQTRAT